jgi:hypothetical protein
VLHLYGEQEDTSSEMVINEPVYCLKIRFLISSGAGIMTITDKYIEQFNSLLL